MTPTSTSGSRLPVRDEWGVCVERARFIGVLGLG